MSFAEHDLDTAIVVLATPFADGAVDEPSARALVHRTTAAGVSAITVNGNTGEFYALTTAERRQMTGICIAEAGTAVPICSVGGDLATAMDDARHAVALGSSYVMVHQPVQPHWSIAGWVDYHEKVAAAVPGANLIAYVRDPRIGWDPLTQLLDRCPSVCAVKYAVRDLVTFGLLSAQYGDRCRWICGLGDGWAPAFWDYGARGFTSGLGVALPELSLELLAGLREADADAVARCLQTILPLEKLRDAESSQDNIAVVKEALAIFGVCGQECRAPCSTISSDKARKIRELLAAYRQIGP